MPKLPTAKIEPAVTQKMIWERFTKHYHVYVASDFGMPIPTLYISRNTWPNGQPAAIVVTVTEFLN